MAVVACYHLRTQGLETMAHRKCYHESSSKPLLEEVYVGKHLSFCQGGKAVRGNAMVANPAFAGDETGGLGKRGLWWNRNPLHIPKGCVIRKLSI